MAEGIDYRPIGTIAVEFDNKTYVLRRPKLRQYRHFRDQIHSLAVAAAEKIQAMQAEIDEDGPDTLEIEFRHLTANTYEITSVPWLKEAFSQLGDPLPEDHDEWPAWLAADQTIPGQILNHWRSVPLAPGAKGTNSP